LTLCFHHIDSLKHDIEIISFISFLKDYLILLMRL
jgi:hypothetical protein